MTIEDKLKSQLEIASYLTMRKTVGWLGMLLPFLLLIGNYVLNQAGIFTNPDFVQLTGEYQYQEAGSWKSSVSHYYYTTVGEFFTGTLCAVAMFMICYTGHTLRPQDKGLSDNAMTNLAGLFAIGVASFPTTSDTNMSDNLRSFLSSELIGWVHYGFAFLFFLVLALMCIINFRRAENPDLFGTGPDDPFYLRCGILMLVWIGLVPICAQVDVLERNHSTFILEAFALITFGVSWLKKGKADFNFLPAKLGLTKKKVE
jgi:heme A synthase